MSKLTVDILQEEFGDEVLGQFIRNTIDGGLNPWRLSGVRGISRGFYWDNAQEGYSYWLDIFTKAGGLQQ